MHKLILRCLLLSVLITTPIAPTAGRAQHGGESAALAPGGDFSLTDHDGRQFRLRDQAGKVVLLFFGYTSCTEACPVILGKVNSAFKQLGADAGKALAVFISVDPGRDTTQVLSDYVHYFSAKTVALTGKKQDIDAVVKQYGARYEIEKSDSALGYHVNHSTDIYLIDQQGTLRSRFKHTDSGAVIAEGVRRLIR